jgi:hypothetical protein
MKDFSVNDRNNTLLKVLVKLRDEPNCRPEYGGICFAAQVLTNKERKENNWPDETIIAVRSLLALIMRKWPEKAAGDPSYPVNGSLRAFARESDAKKAWRNPLRIKLLNWLIDELTCNEPVYVWPDLEWTFKSEYSAEVFRHKGDDFWVIDHPVFNEKLELLL